MLKDRGFKFVITLYHSKRSVMAVCIAAGNDQPKFPILDVKGRPEQLCGVFHVVKQAHQNVNQFDSRSLQWLSKRYKYISLVTHFYTHILCSQNPCRMPLKANGWAKGPGVVLGEAGAIPTSLDADNWMRVPLGGQGTSMTRPTLSWALRGLL